MPARPSLMRLLVSIILSLILVTPVAASERPRVGDLRPINPVEPPSSSAAYVPDELVVGFEPGISAGARGRAIHAAGATVKREVPGRGPVVLGLPAGGDVHAAAASFRRRPGVLFAEPNFIYLQAATPNDPRFGDLWGLHEGSDHDIDAPEAWDITTGSPKVVVAVVDTGVDWRHPDLASNIWRNPRETANGADDDGNGLVDDLRGWDFVADDNNPKDQDGHGTHVAGTIGARGNNSSGITGVNWNVRIMALRAGNASGLTNADIIGSFNYACAKGARIINGSFGGPGNSQGILNAINGCPNALFVFAAGNSAVDNDAAPSYPCNYPAPNIVCVAATDSDDELADFSNYGASQVDLAAPGQSILSASHAQFLFRDGFESGFGKWVPGKLSGTSWSRTSEAAASGTYSATDSAGAAYQNNSNTWMDTASPISLQGGTGCLVDWAVELDTEFDVDGVLVEGTRDGGSTWQLVDGVTGTTSGEFAHLTSSLKAAGFDGARRFLLSFRLVSDGLVTGDGTHIDDVAVRCITGTHGGNDYVYFDGTSMATPHVAGVAALVLAAHPNLTADQLRQALLDGVDDLPSLAGKVVTGGRLNAFGALSSIENVPPVAFAPTQQVEFDSTLGESEIPVRVRWDAASDEAPSSGIFGYRLQKRRMQAGEWSAWSTVVTTPNLTRSVSLTPGEYQFRLRAEDRAGNASPWMLGDVFALRDPQGSPPISFSGTWTTHSGSQYYDGSTRYASTQGRSAVLAFTGREVALVSTRGPNRGRAKIFVDGALVETVDLYAPTFRNRRVVFTELWSSADPHTIEVKVITRNASSTGSRVDLDAFVTLR